MRHLHWTAAPTNGVRLSLCGREGEETVHHSKARGSDCAECRGRYRQDLKDTRERYEARRRAVVEVAR